MVCRICAQDYNLAPSSVKVVDTSMPSFTIILFLDKDSIANPFTLRYDSCCIYFSLTNSISSIVFGYYYW
uniref:Expressed protein n=1 Tax=Echinococcus granulosus TaxID=6210 RepID=A0A068WFI7_ECHGR|nr:expressed protein [Echinococcus granulosus]